MKYRKSRFVVWSMLLLSLVAALSFHWLLLDPVNEDNLGKLKDGMLRAEVDDLLGAPAQINKLENGYWAMWRGRHLAIHIRFNEQERIVEGDGEVLFTPPGGFLETIRTFVGL
jgi:hypothetical protein